MYIYIRIYKSWIHISYRTFVSISSALERDFIFSFFVYAKMGSSPNWTKKRAKLKFQWLTIGLMDVNGTINIVNYIVHGE